MPRHYVPRLDLFPFLSVLLCTLGSLTLLLLVLTEQACNSPRSGQDNRHLDFRLDVDQPVVKQPASNISALILLEELWHIEQGTKHLEEELAAVERESRLLREQRTAIEKDSVALRVQVENRLAEIDQLRARQQALSERCRLLSSKLRAMQVPPQLAPEKREVIYQLIPHPAQGGSWRPPIVVEAVNGRAVFLASGLAISADQDQAAERFRQAVLETQRALQSSDKPYILLLVRPSGFVLHYLVPKWLEDSDWEIGYELVPEDWRIEIGQEPVASSDPVMRKSSAAGMSESRAGSSPTSEQPGSPTTNTTGKGNTAWTAEPHNPPASKPGAVAITSKPAAKSSVTDQQTSAAKPVIPAKPAATSTQGQTKPVAETTIGSGTAPGVFGLSKGKQASPRFASETGAVTLVCRSNRIDWPAQRRSYAVLAENGAWQTLLMELDNWRAVGLRSGLSVELRIRVEPAGTLVYYELASRLARSGWVWQVEWLPHASDEPAGSVHQVPGNRER
jgi:hypothetical protein